ncbi:hypothetical protein BX666DRAFT_1863944 [Dichotomocladium elegans]|nr:hypothetical protein BX666DRAFT_1863944 [Dichotomocladium elegans]
MKSIQLGLSGNRFDDQYTFDLQGYITVHDFNSAMCLFNEAVRQHPPPGHKGVWCATLVSMWALAGVTIYTVWACLLAKESPVILLVIPVMVLLTTILWVWRYRYLQRVFQCSLFELCSRINATENIRGINYRLVKHGHHDMGHPHNAHQRLPLRWHASYASLWEWGWIPVVK